MYTIPPYKGLKAKVVSVLNPIGFVQLIENGVLLEARTEFKVITIGEIVEVLEKDFSGIWLVRPMNFRL